MKDFEAVLADLDAPMAVVTVTDGHERSGCLVGFHSQCSIEPRRWLVCISKKNHTYEVAQRAHIIVVHLLRRDERELAELFGGETSDEVDKFARCTWRPGPDGTPILASSDWIAGRIIERIDVGDHVAHLLDVIDAGKSHPGAAAELGFQTAKDIKPGHPP